MTLERVDFYLLNQNVPDGKLRATCRLVKKALAQGYTTYVQIAESTLASRLDDLMWTFDQGSFIPHKRDGDGDDPAPVVIGAAPSDEAPPDLLISLVDDVPRNSELCRRIADIVDHIDTDKQLARERYKVYKGRGCQLETHHINP